MKWYICYEKGTSSTFWDGMFPSYINADKFIIENGWVNFLNKDKIIRCIKEVHIKAIMADNE